jgi:hypothetical protein
MRPGVFAVAAAALVALVVTTGCGGSGGDGGNPAKTEADKVKQVSEEFNKAFSSGDYAVACDLLHSRRKKDLEFEQSQSCEDILSHAAETDSELVKALGDTKTASVSINGNTATVDLESSGPLGTGRQALLERDGDDWRVSEAAAGF